MKRHHCMFAGMLIVALFAMGCGSHDWFGPVERGARTLFNGWDMWATPSVRPYEEPMPPTLEGVVPVTGLVTFKDAEAQYLKTDAAYRQKRGPLVYRRFCYHCHGANGDGRIIVGESFAVKPTDLRREETQALSDEDLYDVIADGFNTMLGLRASMTPEDIIQSIHYMRTLKNAPSSPFFKPRNTQPLE